MAQVDSSIALQARGVQDPLDSYGKALTLKGLGQQQQMQEAQFAKYQQDQANETTLNDLYRGSVDPAGKLDRNALLSGAASRGLGSRIPTLQKGFAEQDKAAADAAHTGAQTSETNLKVQKQKLDLAGAAISSLLANPNVSHEDVVGTVHDLVDRGVMQPDQGAQIVRRMPGNPQALRQFLVQQGSAAMDASKRMEMLLPQLQAVNLGGSMQMVDKNAVTNPGAVGQSLPMSQSPESVASNATAVRGQNLVNARGIEANSLKAQEIAMGGKPPPGYRWTTDGRLEAIPGGPGDKLPEKQQNQVIGTQNLSNAITEYREQLKKFGPLDAAKPDARAAMGTKYNNMMLQAKEAYNLGVLNGPDLEILTSVITDPRSLKGVITSKGALDQQAAELDRIMQGITAVSANRRPQDAKPAEKPVAPKPGFTDGGWVFTGGDPGDRKNWKKQ